MRFMHSASGLGCTSRRLQYVCVATLLSLLLHFTPTASAALIDVWRADDLRLNDSDAVASWTSASNRVATANLGEQPVLKLNATPAGSSAVRFNGSHRLSAASPVGGRTAFSVALVFRANAAGANNSAHWWGKTGLVDAEEPGVVNDWGTAINEGGQVAIGTGNSDVTTYSTGTSLVDTNFHVAVFTWGGGSQAVYVDNRSAVVNSGVATAARNNAGISLGGIRTGEVNRRFNGDFVEVRFYDNALSASEATNVIAELMNLHVSGNLPRIVTFTASTNQIYLGAPVTLSWNATNATSVTIDQGVGTFASSGSTPINPTATTTYTLTATNLNGVRTASVTIQVDPGVPSAFAYNTNTPRNTPVQIPLRASDPNGGTLTYSVVTPPQHGSLSGAAPNLTYTPTSGYEGFDSFTFKANDGQFDSDPATVTIKVIPPAAAPTAILLSSTNIPTGTRPGAFIAGLRAIDVNNQDGDTQSFALVSGFGDNANFQVIGNALHAGSFFSGSLGSQFAIRLRATDSSGLTYEQTHSLRVVEVDRTVVINEVHYNGAENTVRDNFIELYNPTSQAIDLSRWRIADGLDYTFPANTILPANGFLIVAEQPEVMTSVYGVPAFGPWSGGLNNEGDVIQLRDAQGRVLDEVSYKSEFPWPVGPNGTGASMQLVNPALDNDLGGSWRTGAVPTPGATNVVFAANAAPHIRQVDHLPQQPRTNESVTITAKVTDPEGVASVVLAYQLVAPGQFIPSTLPLTSAQLNNFHLQQPTNALNPAFEAATNWVTVPMHDDGLDGDLVAGDDIYTAILPQRGNRTLVRYRITCTDTLGASRRAPFEDDPSLNFAYFVYNGIPAYQGTAPATLQTLPVYTLITRDADINQCTAWFNTGDQLPNYVNGNIPNDGRNHFNWEGAFVYEGKVFDHIKYRLRGANGRYHPGKRSFRFKFNDGALFQARDNNGVPFPTKWKEVTTGKGHSNRGSESFAVNEVVNYYLFNKVGVPAPDTLFFHFRVVRGADENGANQYSGDFWGLNWAQEKYDTRFLDNHGLPKANLYKLNDHRIDAAHELRYQGPNAVTNGADFWNVQTNLNGFRPTEWLLAYANYTNWYRYHAISEAVRNYDFWPSANKNAVWYFEPLYGPTNNYYGRLMVLPYDMTDTWGPTWNGGEDLLFNGIFPSGYTGGDQGQNPELQKEYRNVVREVRDLLFQPDQINGVIDAFAGVITPFAPADRTRWLAAPAPASYTALAQTLGTQSPGVSSGLGAYVQDMKNFMFVGGNNPWWVDRNSVPAGGWVTRLDQIAAADANVPTRPTITYTGTNGFPVDGLVFRTSDFADPNGANTFGAIRWRIAEVLPPGTAITNPSQLKLEWDAAWDSGEITSFNSFVTIPDWVVKADHLYRVRVRHMDNTGRWSQWSLPIEFRPGPRDTVRQLKSDLVFSEIMYNPPGLGATSGDEFEFLELRNNGSFTLNLSGLYFSAGLTFTFTNGTTLAPGATFLLGRNANALKVRYPGLVVHGIYGGGLNNSGETLTISHPIQGEVVSVTYADRAPWPVAADGSGFSLVLADPLTGEYRASATRFGTPGADGPVNGIGGVVINEVLSSSTLPLRDAIELWNSSSTNIDISHWLLSDDASLPQKYRIPAGTLLAPGEFRVFTEEQFNPGGGVSFGLSSFGDDIYLFSADSSAQLTGYSHGFTFGAAADGVSFGRYVNSAGEEDLVLQSSRTLGAVNAAPRVGPVVISEINYHPRGTNDEYLELRNISASTVNMYDPAVPTNTWKVSGVGFSFPSGATIPAGGTVLLVNSDPTSFRDRWSVPAAVQIYRYTGNLQDSGERLEVQAPDAPTIDGVPYYATDLVRYNDRKPWPLAADGAGASLHRLVGGDYGNDATNWVGALPTPGSTGLAGSPPVFTQHPVTQTNFTTGTVVLQGAVTGSMPMFYQWRFDGSNLDGATNSSLVLSGLQQAQGGTYQLVAYNTAGAADSSNALLVVRVGPTLTASPASTIVRVRPDPFAAPQTNVTFTVAAQSYNPPLRYQWYLNDLELAGATNASLTITNVTVDDEGAYHVRVYDTVGYTVSTQAMLYPLVAPVLTLNPVPQRVVPGAVVTVSAAATGNPLPIGWEWRRVNTTIASNAANERFSFLTFVNTNPVGSTISYRVVARIFSSTATTTFNVVTVADADGDGIADEWETQYGLNSGSAADRDIDADGDGVSNWGEYTAGTNPTDAASRFEASLTLSNGIPTVSFNALSNRTYSVQYKDTLQAPAWTTWMDILASTNNHAEVLLDTAGSTNRFYRVVTPRQ